MAKLTLIPMLVVNLISVSIVKAADISIDPSSHPSMTSIDKANQRIILRGEIVRGDYKKLINMVKINGNIPENIFLNSRGGDVIEAMKIGRFARRGLLITGVIRSKDDYRGAAIVIVLACLFILLVQVRSLISM